jgi:hypothetical protein
VSSDTRNAAIGHLILRRNWLMVDAEAFVDAISNHLRAECAAEAAEKYERRIAELEETCLLLGTAILQSSLGGGFSDQTRQELHANIRELAARVLKELPPDAELGERKTEPPEEPS